MPAFHHRQPVRFADVDHAGIVYYPRFLDYCHQAFEELWRQRRGERAYVELLDQRRLGLPAVHVEADYRRPARFGDALDIAIELVRVGSTSVSLRYRLTLADQPAAVVAEVTTVCVCVDLDTFGKTAMPEDVRALWAELA